MIQKQYEHQLLARIIANKDDYYDNADVINEELFVIYTDIYTKFYDLVKDGRYPTLTKLLAELPDRKDDLLNIVRSADHNVPILELVEELDEHRKQRILNQVMTSASLKDNSEEKVRVLSDGLMRLYATDKAGFIDGYTAAKNAMLSLQQRTTAPEIPTGFAYFDLLTGGLQRSDLVIVAGETSQGKTAFALNIVQHVLDAGKSVSVISLEMTEEQLMLRMVSSKSGVPVRELPNSYDKATDAVSSYIGQGIHIADVTNNSAVKILGMIRSAKIRYDIDVVVIDYLQLVSDKSQKSREQEVGQITRSLKNIAKELHICVVALSQLRRSPGSHYPTLSRLRDSGQVEEAADVVVFVYRPEVYGDTEWDDGTVTENEAEIIIAKGRNYGIGKFRCRFIKEITKFGDFSDRTRHEGFEGVPSPVKEDLPF